MDGHRQDKTKFQNTLYNSKEILAARLEFARNFYNVPSRALLSLMRKCQYAINGPHHLEKNASFANDYFCKIQDKSKTIDEPKVQENGTSEDSSLGFGKGIGKNISPDVSPETDEKPLEKAGNIYSNVMKLQSSMVRGKRKRDETEKTLKSQSSDNSQMNNELLPQGSQRTEPELKKTRRTPPESHERVGQESSLIQWKCDLCDVMQERKKNMLLHLQSSQHHSASLCNCVLENGKLHPVTVLIPAGLKEYGLGNTLIPVCPFPNCYDVSTDIYQCSLLCVQKHKQFDMVNQYAIGEVKRVERIYFPLGKKHNFDKSVQDRSKIFPNLFVTFNCPQCYLFFSEFSRAQAHVVKCFKSEDVQPSLWVLHVIKQTCREHVKNHHAMTVIKSEILNLLKHRETLTNRIRIINVTKRLEFLKKMQTEIHVIMKYPCVEDCHGSKP